MTVHTLLKAKSAPRVTPPDAVPNLVRELGGIVHLLTCGSVDDGKSTLIGRMLWDASDLYEDQRESVRRSGRKAAGTDQPDFSMLLDGLVAERDGSHGHGRAVGEDPVGGANAAGQIRRRRWHERRPGPTRCRRGSRPRPRGRA